MSTIGNLVVSLVTELGQFSSGLKRAEGEMKTFGSRVESQLKKIQDNFLTSGTAANFFSAQLDRAFNAALQGVVNLTREAATMQNAIAEASARTLVGVSALARLGNAALQSGTEFGDLEKTLKRLTLSTSKALIDPDGKQAQAFAALGVSIATLRSADPEAIFKEVADGAKAITDPLERAAALNDVFGKSFANLLPLLDEGSAGINRLGAEYERLTGGLTAEAAAQTAQLFDELDNLKTASLAAAGALLNEFGPELIATVKSLTEFAINVRKAAEDIGDFVRFIVSLGKQINGLLPQLALFNAATGRLSFDQLRANSQGVIDALDGVGKGTKESGGRFSELAGILAEGTTLLKRYTVGVSDAAKPVKPLTNSLRELGNAEKARKAEFDKAFAGSNAYVQTQIRQQEAAKRFTESVLASIDPLKALREELRKQTDLVAASGLAADKQREAVKKLTADYDREKFAIQQRNAELAKQPLEAELAKLQKLITARKLGNREYQIELIVQRELSGIRATSAKDLERETEALRKRAGALVDGNQALANAQPPAGLGEAFARALEETDFSSFFTKFISEFGAAFKANPLQVTADLAGLAATIAAATQGSGSDARRGISNLLAQSQIPVVSQIAQIANAVDAIFGGRLFGTNFKEVASGLNAVFNSAGLSGNTVSIQQRERSLFRGTQTRTNTGALDSGTQSALDSFFTSVRASVAAGARLLAVSVPDLIAGSFREIKDKDGRIKEQISQVGGRIFKEGFEDFQRRIQAENIISVVSRSAAEAGGIAEQWRTSAGRLLDGAQLLLRAQADISRGVSLLTNGTLAEVATLTQELAQPGEALAATYGRLREQTALYVQALEAVGTLSPTVTASFVKFSDELTNLLGGIEAAGNKVSAAIASFFDPQELAEAQGLALRRTLAETERKARELLGESFDLPIKELLRSAFSGAVSPEQAAAIINYANALGALNASAEESARVAFEAAQAAVEAAAEARNGIRDLSLSIQRQIRDFTGSDFSRSLEAIRDQFNVNIRAADEFARVLGIAGEGTEAYSAALQLYSLQLDDLQRDTRASILRGLLDLYGESADIAARTAEDYARVLTGGLGSGVNGAQAWRAELAALERESKALGVAANIRDLFGSFGQSAVQGFSNLGLDTKAFLKDLGLDISNFATVGGAKFGAIARSLGLTLQQLADISGFDLSTLTPEQRTQAEAAQAQKTETEKTNSELAKIHTAQVAAELARDEQTEVLILSASEQTNALTAINAALASQNATLTRLVNELTRTSTAQAVGL